MNENEFSKAIENEIRENVQALVDAEFTEVELSARQAAVAGFMDAIEDAIFSLTEELEETTAP
jgi:hypothetical protein